MDSLKFIETMSVADFKTKMEVERIDVKQTRLRLSRILIQVSASLFMAVKQVQ